MADNPPLKVPQPDDTTPEDRELNAEVETQADTAPPDSQSSGAVWTQAIFYGPRRQPTEDPYDLGRLFLEWAWSTGIREWQAAVRVLARTLHGLQGTGLIERRTVRRAGHATHHGLVLTDLGRAALDALAGEWIKDRR